MYLKQKASKIVNHLTNFFRTETWEPAGDHPDNPFTLRVCASNSPVHILEISTFCKTTYFASPVLKFEKEKQTNIISEIVL